jgi:hypothetical protein
MRVAHEYQHKNHSHKRDQAGDHDDGTKSSQRQAIRR